MYHEKHNDVAYHGVIISLSLVLHYVKGVRIQSYSSPYFPVFGLNTERYLVSLRLSPNAGKCGPE